MMSDPSPMLMESWFRDVLAQLDPRRLTRTILVGDQTGFQCGEEHFAVAGNLVIVAIGKAAVAMAAGAQDALGNRFREGYVLTVDGPDAGVLDERWTVYRGGHPIPSQQGIEASRAIVKTVEQLGNDDVVLALISGGSSALFEAPRTPLSLGDVAELTRLLLHAGAPIQDLNAVRIPLSDVKGGSFRQRSPSGRFVTLVLSDVLGNDPQVIASGPTVESQASASAAFSVLDTYGLRDTVPAPVRFALEDAASDSQVWDYPGDLLEIIGDNRGAVELAEIASQRDGYNSQIIWSDKEGEASELGREWIAALLELPDEVDAAWGGGEATVTVRGDGKGGRNTEFALAAALELDRLENDDWFVASLATDGQDAATGSAGAISARESIARGRELDLDAEESLAHNDSATFFEHVGGLVLTGPSGTNVNDLYLGLRRRKR